MREALGWRATLLESARDDDLTNAILEAAGELLLDVGFDRLRIQDVAKQAGAGKGAYRRWPTKEALLAEAIRVMPDYEPDITDDPVADLRQSSTCDASPRAKNLISCRG